MTKRILVTVGILGLISIILGAFGSHLLNGKISEVNMSIYQTGLLFQIYHTLALLAITFMNRYVSRSYINIIYYFFTVGVALFSGSLYVISTSEVTNIIIGFMGFLTPLGGISLALGWATLIFVGVTYEHKKRAIHNE